MDDFSRVDPPYEAPEQTMLNAFLDFHRATLLWKLEGLSDEQLLRPVAPSGWCLLGLVKHLAYVERGWFREVFAGEDLPHIGSEDDPDADWRIEPGETTEQILELYRSEVRLARWIAEAGRLDEEAAREGRSQTLRWIIVHMIEETARHNGHADIVRELLDGSTGE